MKALVLHAIGDIRLESVAVPKPKEGEVLIRVACCGVCGSDIPRIFKKGTYQFPTICGHEFAGTVEQIGPGVESFQPADRVAVFPLLWCGRCEACERGRYAQCSNYGYLGSRDDGAFAEFVVAPERNLLRLPEEVSFAEAAMIEPAAVALHAIRSASCSLVGEMVVLFGAGPIGMMVAQWARILGAEEVVLFDLVPGKLALAKELGFDKVYQASEVDAVRQIERLTDGRGAHLTFDSAGCPQTLLNAVSTVAVGGRVVLLGNPSGDVTIPASLLSQIMRREACLVGTWNSDFRSEGSDDDWHTTVRMLSEKRLDVESLVSHRVSLQEGIEVLKKMRDQTEFFSKVLLCPGD